MKIPKIVMVIGVVIAIIVGLMGPYSIKEKVIYTFSMVFWGATGLGGITLLDYIIKKQRRKL
ncbi:MULTISPECIES: hypothetical protein [Bacillus cereus group]|uniref:Uncharacterized protein n=1 Tax=Bacillus thuringiensis TaxID=1428 RepID=A0A1C4CV84_BACTU|nr:MULTISPECIES: hypothetical protein [Bacillus cereus group]MED3022889.1 hypothetical protein [Bacillus wiedmannii]OTX95581.1 hypothetical protein BK729_23175 [Bacillus thuringiensis serovar wratislaviensis]OUB63105.1 hypothetical protein BK743_04075 [Bacillus thuringiensis serovar sylvestriensis]SCC22949.1 Uncharacterized protein BTT61001_02051 [Bacillus thuringiensis]